MSPKCCIFRTPPILSRHNKQAYIPDAFSIGPLHHGGQNLKAMEKIKAKYLQDLIDRSPIPSMKLRELINSIQAVENEARECYADEIAYTPYEFTEILVIDGCFTLELFYRDAYRNIKDMYKRDDPVFTKPCMLQFLQHDLILLENQVPWMVLELLFNKTRDPGHQMTLIELATSFFTDMFSSKIPFPNDSVRDVKHIPDLLRKFLISTSRGEEEGRLHLKFMPSATRLLEAGIKFKRGPSDKCILDIKFTNGFLEIPPILIHQTTETAFRNLISFEQCYCIDARITSYAIFLDNLINTTDDMEKLCERKIVNNLLNPEDATKFFNKLYHDTYVAKFHYETLGLQVNRYCQHKVPRWRAILVRNYFSNPWIILSTLGAIIILILTFVQTIYTVE
ncbi:UPF0481 protein At3g47200-like [Alnus glutinosa]|uniref:UPF0481 protein At3g47200-like n=1 Tax=Alnus glutinosa TaxID=3517 RepID=UPI002D7A2219|nr:UPF0481 protein At3g47200-like [Alnus glutinosa]